MRTVYLDNAANSFPKAPGVGEAMADAIQNMDCNVGGSCPTAHGAAGMVLDTRQRLAALLGCPAAGRVLFTPGAACGLNFMLKGLMRPGDRVLASPLEHDAVMRPLRKLEARGAAVELLPCDEQGRLDLDQTAQRIAQKPRAVIMTHASNVSGGILPIEAVGALCRAAGVFFLVDAAQTAGSLPIQMEDMCIDGLALSGHKGLLGPQGIGAVALSAPLARALGSQVSGSTDSTADTMEAPVFLEAGTLNLPGIYGLNAALRYLEREGEGLRRRLRKRSGHLWARMMELEEDGLRVLGPDDPGARTGVVSVDWTRGDNGQLALRLEQEYGVYTRCGCHCAPAAHRALGSFPQGAVRFSVGPFTTFEDLDYAQGAVYELLYRG